MSMTADKINQLVEGAAQILGVEQKCSVTLNALWKAFVGSELDWQELHVESVEGLGQERAAFKGRNALAALIMSLEAGKCMAVSLGSVSATSTGHRFFLVRDCDSVLHFYQSNNQRFTLSKFIQQDNSTYVDQLLSDLNQDVGAGFDKCWAIADNQGNYESGHRKVYTDLPIFFCISV